MTTFSVTLKGLSYLMSLDFTPTSSHIGQFLILVGKIQSHSLQQKKFIFEWFFLVKSIYTIPTSGVSNKLIRKTLIPWFCLSKPKSVKTMVRVTYKVVAISTILFVFEYVLVAQLLPYKYTQHPPKQLVTLFQKLIRMFQIYNKL